MVDNEMDLPYVITMFFLIFVPLRRVHFFTVHTPPDIVSAFPNGTTVEPQLYPIRTNTNAGAALSPIRGARCFIPKCLRVAVSAVRM